MTSIQQAITAIQLLAINDRLKSFCISGPIGSGKSQVLKLYDELSDREKVVIPTHVTINQLLGGISLDETLQQQKIVYEKSIFERTDRGFFLVEHIDRFEPMTIRMIARAIEEQSIQFVRDEVIEKQLHSVALYTTQVPFEQLPDTLLDCIGISVTLSSPEYEKRVAVLKNDNVFDIEDLRKEVQHARDILPQVQIQPEQLKLIAEQLSYYGLFSMRAHFSWIEAARAFCAFQNEFVITDEHILSVRNLVLNHRTNELIEQDAPPPPSNSQNETKSNTQKEHGEDVLIDVDATEQGEISLEVEEQLKGKKGLTGKTSEQKMNKKRGRQIGIQAYKKENPDLDLLATLKKAIPEQPLYEKGETKIVVKPHHFVNKKREQKQAQHFIFVVDASQSMHQHNQMTAVKGVVLSLLKNSYQKRNVISFISMYQQQAEVKLQTSKNISLARTMLEHLKVGGKTPLSSALKQSKTIIENSSVPIESTKLLIFTDGRANITLNGEKNVRHALLESSELASEISKLGVQSLVIDTEMDKVKLQKAKQLAEALRGHYISFSDFSNMKTYQFIRNGG